MSNLMYRADNFKASRFNEFLDLINNRWVIYNNLTGAMVEVPKMVYEALIKNKVTDIKDEKKLEKLKYGNFIINKAKDEIEEFKRKQKKYVDECKVIGLQILPSLNCCCNCIYCYEKPDNTIPDMNQKVMDDILRFLEFKIQPTTGYLNVLWFGGEPLLAINQIEYLSDNFTKLSQKMSINYNAFIITNGYLLNDKNVDILIKSNVRGCQVTIDGPEEIHNKRRMLSNGGKTYKKIIDNLKYALSKNLRICIWVNVDKTNIDHIDKLFLDLEGEGIFRKVSFTFGLVTRFGKVCRSIEDTLLTTEKATEIFEKKKINQLLSDTLNSTIRPLPDYLGCVATAKNSIIIGPQGELYKCSKTVGDNNEVCGNISAPDWDNPNLKKWENLDNFSIDNCRKCSLITTCRGTGCAFDLIIDNKDIYDCNRKELKKFHLNRLKLLYRSKLNLKKN